MVCLARQSAAVCAPSFSARTRDVHRKRLDAPPTRRANGRSGQVLRAPVRAVGSSERASDKELEMQKLEKKVEIRDTGRYPTIEDYVGETPLVRLQRLPGNTSNVILAKLEGNNPAGDKHSRCNRTPDCAVICCNICSNTTLQMLIARVVIGIDMLSVFPSRLREGSTCTQHDSAR
eukprot:1195840-Prorocentrum_minimum.AAC.2